MAQGKKSFVLYTDLLHTVKKLPNEKAGELFKHILNYVNDNDPQTDDMLIEIAFEPIKQSLKRDLKKYESIVERNKINGSKGGRPKKQEKPKKPNGLNKNPNKPKKADSDSVSVIDNEIDINNTLLSELKSSDFEDPKYFEITISFYELFKKNLIENGAQITNLEKAKGNWINHIRLLIEKDNYSIEDLQKVWKFLQEDEFWKMNILSTSKLRKQFDKLILKTNGKENRTNNKGATDTELAGVLYKHFGDQSQG